MTDRSMDEAALGFPGIPSELLNPTDTTDKSYRPEPAIMGRSQDPDNWVSDWQLLSLPTVLKTRSKRVLHAADSLNLLLLLMLGPSKKRLTSDTKHKSQDRLKSLIHVVVTFREQTCLLCSF